MDQDIPTDPHADIRDEVRKLCVGFPGPYWRELDRSRTYPTEFVQALSDGGWLSALIPEEYGGSGLPLSAACAILEEIQHAGCNGAACHAQMYIMGALLRHGSAAQKAEYLPKIARGELRLQAFGVTEPSAASADFSAAEAVPLAGLTVVRTVQTHRAPRPDFETVPSWCRSAAIEACRSETDRHNWPPTGTGSSTTEAATSAWSPPPQTADPGLLRPARRRDPHARRKGRVSRFGPGQGARSLFVMTPLVGVVARLIDPALPRPHRFMPPCCAAKG